ncbi:MAG: tRNA 5-methoxyuridine(34)/uridine 5-oxyacetic acid(34) synthase CmoB [Gammaproteobacteria bacterium]|nr:tRNA 5-methoxyuridine(34)/uridine 5-oxyacetic acid(34) synthase CmoB [Gammaproteobacteria bacterium]
MSLEKLFQAMQDTSLQDWLDILPKQLDAAFDEKRHGNLPRWRDVLNQLPMRNPGEVELNGAVVTARSDGAQSDDQHQALKALLQQLMPWRKGPYELDGVYIDTEWHSDWKWDRIAPHISSLQGRRVLDVGCGSGYHCWRMAGAGAELVIGIDPSILFAMQFEAVKHFIGDDYPVYMLPLGIQDVPPKLQAFDTVFSMGVLYHRRSPIDHLMELRDCLRPGGELVLETLVIEGGPGESLMPEGRYAKMRNVWFIPSVPTLELWLRRCGFVDIRTVDISHTTVEEQRQTEWMQFESLANFLDLEDHTRTIEGYPAPIRATVIATLK